jgi:hypothetical protein
MQIGSGPSPLSLAILKTLGAQPAAPPAAAQPAGKAAAVVPARMSAADPADTAAGGRTPPRGSFVDLRA